MFIIIRSSEQRLVKAERSLARKYEVMKPGEGCEIKND